LIPKHIADFLFIFLLIINKMNLKRPLFKICILTKPGQCRIYGVHDEAKDKAFELELSWICDESKRQHQKVPNELLEHAKAAAQAAFEEMHAD